MNKQINTVKIVDLKERPQNKIRFGGLVVCKIDSAKKFQNYQFAGIDEASILKGKITFVSFIAKLLTNKK